MKKRNVFNLICVTTICGGALLNSHVALAETLSTTSGTPVVTSRTTQTEAKDSKKVEVNKPSISLPITPPDLGTTTSSSAEESEPVASSTPEVTPSSTTETSPSSTVESSASTSQEVTSESSTSSSEETVSTESSTADSSTTTDSSEVPQSNGIIIVKMYDAITRQYVYTREFTGKPSSQLVVPIDATMGKLVEVQGDGFSIGADGSLIGTFPGSEEVKVVSVYLEQVGKQTIHAKVNFIDENNNPVIGAPGTIYYGKPGETITFKPAEVPGYTYVGETSFVIPEDFVQGEFFIFTARYERKELTLTFKYVDEAGNTIMNDTYVKGKIGDTGKILPGIIPGYTFKGVKQVVETAPTLTRGLTNASTNQYTFSATNETVVLEYTKKGNAVIDKPVVPTPPSSPTNPGTIDKQVVSLTNTSSNRSVVKVPVSSSASSVKTLPQTGERTTKHVSMVGLLAIALTLPLFYKKKQQEA